MRRWSVVGIGAIVCAALVASGCGKVTAQDHAESGGTGPVPGAVKPEMDANDFKVDHAERFALATAGEHIAAPELNVTGVVSADVSRQVPVPSLATGRVVEIDTRLGDEVKKGQMLFKVRSTDISGAYSDYRQAVKNEELTKIQLARAKLLFDDGAIPRSALEIAQNAEDDNLIVLETTKDHLHLLDADPEHPTPIVEVRAPVAGTITDQEISIQSAVQALTPPNPFTISDMSHVWIVCDVWENDMAQVHLGEFADIHLAAFPNRVLKGRISNILPIVDPTIRTAKVRIEVENPGSAASQPGAYLMRLGMFVTATFHGLAAEKHATVPATAILHLHDRQWVYVPLGDGHFKRQEVVAGITLPGKLQEVNSGLKPGDRVIADALVLENTVEQ